MGYSLSNTHRSKCHWYCSCPSPLWRTSFLPSSSQTTIAGKLSASLTSIKRRSPACTFHCSPQTTTRIFVSHLHLFIQLSKPDSFCPSVFWTLYNWQPWEKKLFTRTTICAFKSTAHSEGIVMHTALISALNSSMACLRKDATILLAVICHTQQRRGWLCGRQTSTKWSDHNSNEPHHGSVLNLLTSPNCQV